MKQNIDILRLLYKYKDNKITSEYIIDTKIRYSIKWATSISDNLYFMIKLN